MLARARNMVGFMCIKALTHRQALPRNRLSFLTFLAAILKGDMDTANVALVSHFGRLAKTRRASGNRTAMRFSRSANVWSYQ